MSRFLPLPPVPEPVCAECVAHDGLCASHRKGVLPAPLKTNWPVWLMGEQHYNDAHDESAEGRKVRERKERKRAKRQRFLRALAGHYTRAA